VNLLPIEVRIGVELCENFPVLSRLTVTTVHLEEIGVGVDVHVSIFVALCNQTSLRGNTVQDHCDRWHMHSSYDAANESTGTRRRGAAPPRKILPSVALTSSLQHAMEITHADRDIALFW
jgi:hypothetical protein